MCSLHISAHIPHMTRSKKIKEEGKKTHISIWIEDWQYNKIQDEIELGESESEAQVVRKALRERFRPKGAW